MSTITEAGNINITISPDKMSAYITTNIQPGEVMEPKDIYLKLEEAGVVYGIDTDKVLKVCQNPQNISNLLIAQGMRSVPGKDAVVNYKYQKPELKPELTEDGKVDFYQLGNIIEVGMDDIIAERIPATEGEPGYNVKGEILNPLPGKNAPFKTGKGIVIRGDTAYPEFAGALNWLGSKVTVSRLMIVNEDVDFSVGNIDFPGKVKIRGHIKSGFKVIAEEDIEVLGCIEDAEVSSTNGSIYVHAGVLGNGKATLQAKNNIEAKFIQGATIKADNNIMANEYILRSNVNAGNAVLIQGLKGRLLGANVIEAGTKISANSIKSPEGLNLKVQGIDRNNIYVRIKEIQTKIKELDAKMLSFSVKIRLLGEKKDSDSQNELGKVLRQYVPMLQEIEELKEENLTLANMLRSTKGDGMIEVHSQVSDGISFSIKEEQVKISKPLKNVTMYFDHKEKRIIIL